MRFTRKNTATHLQCDNVVVAIAAAAAAAAAAATATAALQVFYVKNNVVRGECSCL